MKRCAHSHVSAWCEHDGGGQEDRYHGGTEYPRQQSKGGDTIQFKKGENLHHLQAIQLPYLGAKTICLDWGVCLGTPMTWIPVTRWNIVHQRNRRKEHRNNHHQPVQILKMQVESLLLQSEVWRKHIYSDYTHYSMPLFWRLHICY